MAILVHPKETSFFKAIGKMKSLVGIFVASFTGILFFLNGFYSAAAQKAHNCDTIQLVRIDTLSNHFVLESYLNGNKNQFVKVVVSKENRLLDTISIGQICCLKLFDYASSWVDSNGKKHGFPSMPYCIDLDEQDEVCIDDINFKRLLYLP